MTPERWARIKEVFSAAQEMAESERAAFLEEACGTDELLRKEVEQLLAASSETGLESPVAETLARVAESRLAEGSMLGRYRVECRVGEGGMGAVYRAFDTQLGRPVALKILPLEYTLDPARRSRFLREARAASAISHPNVISIYEAGVEGVVVFIAMEFVEGRSLDKIIPPRGLPTGEALDCAAKIADGLAKAHACGVVHRDLKPGNIMVSRDGAVKLLDFGLAKRVQLGGGRDATLTTQGEILGTPAYMSPEQAEGKEVDPRSDIFSFGSVLYEMLSGRRAFAGDSAVAILGAVLREEPPPLSGVHPELEKLVARCMRKDPARRVQDMDDVRLLLEDCREELARAAAAPAVVPEHRRSMMRVGAIVAVAGTVAGWCLGMLVLSGGTERTGERFTPFATEAAAETMPAWSPDGKSIAYLAGIDGVEQVFMRTLDSPASIRITKSAVSCGPPFWSADGTRIWYTMGDDLWSSGLAGGEPRLELKDAGEAALSPGGKTLVFLRGSMGARSLWTASTGDPEPRQYVREPFPQTFVQGYQPTFFPDSARIGVIVDRGSGGGAGEFWILPLSSGTPRRVPAVLAASAWLRFTWWPDARSVLIGGSDPGTRHLRLMDLETGSIRQFTHGTGQESEPAMSPDWNRIAFTSRGTDLDLVEIPLEGSPISPLLATGSNEESGTWLPPGGQFAYITDVAGTQEVWLRRVGEDWARPILASSTDAVPPWYRLAHLRASPDGQHVAYDVLSAQHRIWISSVAGGRPVPLETESTDQHAASWSPDGNRIAYRRLHDGRYELATIPLGGGQPVPLGDTGPGGHTRGGVTDWSPTGEWICHLGRNGLELVSPDGKRRRLLSPTRPTIFSFSGDGSTLFALRRSVTRKWELAALDVATGAERKARALAVPASADLPDLTRHPDGKRLLTTLGTPRQDIWLMEGFPRPDGWWSRLWRRLPRIR